MEASSQDPWWRAVLVIAALLAGALGLARLGLVLAFQAVAARTWEAGLFLFGVAAVAFLVIGPRSYRRNEAGQDLPVLEPLPNILLAALAAGFFTHAVVTYAVDPQPYVLWWGFFLIDAGFKLAMTLYFFAAWRLSLAEASPVPDGSPP